MIMNWFYSLDQIHATGIVVRRGGSCHHGVMSRHGVHLSNHDVHLSSHDVHLSSHGGQ